MGTAASGFVGFRPEALHFLYELASHNDRAWFQPRKSEYERLLKEPLEALCVELGERFAARRIPLSADAGSPFRIYRDVRFSKDKSPYKSHVSASFPWGAQGGRGVGGYIHIQPGECYVGGGMWHPERERLNAWRALVDRDPGTVKRAIGDRAFVAEFGEVDGERLTRVPSGFAADHPHADLLRLKDVTFGHRIADEDVLGPDLPSRLVDSFAAATPVIRLLAELPAEAWANRR